MWRASVLTILPDVFPGPLGASLAGKALAAGVWSLDVIDVRTFATDRHRTVDDTPAGGGPGMVMKADVWGAALDAILSAEPAGSAVSSVTGARLVVPTPSGVPFTQEMALAYAGERHLVFACGRYEGIDARVVEDARARGMAVDEVSIGDYVLAGGEAAVVVIVEAVCRLLPGVLGNERSVSDDSFGGGGGSMHGLLEGPVYTRPRAWRGNEVPAVLLSGDHAAIARWQRDEALRRTAERRPDLIRRLAAADGLDARDRAVLIQAGFPVDGESMAH